MSRLMKYVAFCVCVIAFFSPFQIEAQVDDDQLGGWYMYFWNADINESDFGFQGDVQYRNWNVLGDLEQLLIRGGLTYQTKNRDVKFTLGYASITTGDFGESTGTVHESRIYQEALIPQKLESRFYLTHRFRFEQRFVEEQDFRTRFRYAIFLNIPLNQKELTQGAIYLALYNEIFINGQRSAGLRPMEGLFDRNRFYGALGYSLTDQLRMQLGLMEQTTDQWSKLQTQLSIHHSF